MTERQKAEALRLMRLFRLENTVRDAFAEEGTLFVSRPVPPGHFGENLPATPAERAIADRFAAETGNAPYHMARHATEMGILYTLFYVGADEAGRDSAEAPTQLWNNTYYSMRVYRYHAGYCLDNTLPMEDGWGEVVTETVHAQLGTLL